MNLKTAVAVTGIGLSAVMNQALTPAQATTGTSSVAEAPNRPTATAAADASTAAALSSWPLERMTIGHNRQAPAGTVWVSVNGSRVSEARAVPRDGSLFPPALVDGPTSERCSLDAHFNRPCLTQWWNVGAETRIAGWWRGHHCILIGSTNPNQATTVNCDGRSRQL